MADAKSLNLLITTATTIIDYDIIVSMGYDACALQHTALKARARACMAGRNHLA